MKEKISFIIPCLNEAETIATVIDKCQRISKKLGLDAEVIVSDNGSTDGSIQIATKHGATVILAQKKGYGSALQCGFENANGDILIMGDADDSYNFEEIGPFLDAYDKHPGTDIVMGNRLKTTIPGAMPPLHRYLGTPVLTRIINLFFGTKISDCNCGMRLITKKAYSQLRMKSSGMEFASEMIIKAALHKMNIIEIPMNLYPDGRRTRRPHLNTWRDGRRHLKYMMLLAPKWILQVPGATLSLLGIGLMLTQVFGPLRIGIYEIDIHFMILGLTLALIGHIVLLIGLILEPLAKIEGIHIYSKTINFLNNASLEKYIIVGGSVFLLGFIIDGSILYNWIREFAMRDPTIEIRKSVFGGYLMFVGLLIFFGGFAWHVAFNRDK